MTRLLPVLLVSLSGCAFAQYAPSLKYCDRVEYQREGREVNITAHCFEAVESSLPIPTIPVKP